MNSGEGFILAAELAFLLFLFVFFVGVLEL